MKKEKKGGFSGQIGFVLAAAGSAVGVGNIWRFPYLVQKDGGGVFLLVYLILIFTFGFALLTSDIAIGRRTGKSSVKAYASINPKWGFLGKLTFVVPALIMTYYAVIGGWITKYAVVYLTGDMNKAAEGDYFTSFITAPVAPIVYGLIFLAVTAFIVFCGIEKGIEKCSKYVMPVLLVMVIGIAIFSLTLKHDGRTGLEGLKYYILPNFTGMTPERFLQVLLDAMGQLFFSLSVSMGIMITYGSYVKKDVNLSHSVSQIEIFDTSVAVLAGMMIIPAIFVFAGPENMNSGPGLMFISLPKVFAAMGSAGRVLGFIFFVMVIFAALTSCISVMETLVSNCMEIFHVSRKKVSIILTIIYAVAAVIVCLGYNKLYFELKLPTGSTGQILDIMDYLSNNFLMPLISFLSTIFIGWVIKPQWIIDEMESSGHKMRRKKVYIVMIKYVAPVMMAILFLQSIGAFNLLKLI